MTARPVLPKLDYLNVLVVDDNLGIRHLVRTMLTMFGASVPAEAGSAEEAMTVLRSQPIDLLVCDWHMEPVDGLELLKTVRTAPDSPNRLLPVVMVSAFLDERGTAPLLQAGANAVVAKPLTLRTFANAVFDVIDRPGAFIRPERHSEPDPGHYGER